MDATFAARVKEIKNDPFLQYREYAFYQFADDGEGVRLREARRQLFNLGLMNSDIRELDEIVIEAAIVNDYVNPDLLTDNDAMPLQNWWWHLGKIRNHTYPVELLPTHLQTIYEDSVTV